MADLRWTHQVEMCGGVVVKRYLAGHPEAGEREWRALTLLAKHLAGCAPGGDGCSAAADCRRCCGCSCWPAKDRATLRAPS